MLVTCHHKNDIAGFGIKCLNNFARAFRIKEFLNRRFDFVCAGYFEPGKTFGAEGLDPLREIIKIFSGKFLSCWWFETEATDFSIRFQTLIKNLKTASFEYI